MANGEDPKERSRSLMAGPRHQPVGRRPSERPHHLTRDVLPPLRRSAIIACSRGHLRLLVRRLSHHDEEPVGRFRQRPRPIEHRPRANDPLQLGHIDAAAVLDRARTYATDEIIHIATNERDTSTQPSALQGVLREKRSECFRRRGICISDRRLDAAARCVEVSTWARFGLPAWVQTLARTPSPSRSDLPDHVRSAKMLHHIRAEHLQSPEVVESKTSG
jgi:hypothetical protein